MPTTLDLARVAALPTHDPIVGRMVGSLFARQAFDDKPEKVALDGRAPDGAIHLTYQRQDDGSVAVDGFFGSVEVHETLRGVDGSFPFGSGSKLFGIAGDETKEWAAVATGTIGGQRSEVQLGVSRSSHEVPMSEELARRGQSVFAWGTQVGLTPSFGGAAMHPRQVPSRYPAASSPVQATDSLYAGGKIGDIELRRHMEWSSTTWTVSHDDNEGWAHQEFFLAEDATARETYARGQEKLRTDGVVPVEVKERGNAWAVGRYVIEAPGAQEPPLEVERTYRSVPAKAVYQVETRVGDQRYSFDLHGAA